MHSTYAKGQKWVRMTEVEAVKRRNEAVMVQVRPRMMDGKLGSWSCNGLGWWAYGSWSRLGRDGLDMAWALMSSAKGHRQDT